MGLGETGQKEERVFENESGGDDAWIGPRIADGQSQRCKERLLDKWPAKEEKGEQVEIGRSVS